MPTLATTTLPFPLFRRGKVRDVYDLGDRLLIVSTDRISAFDVVLSPGVPDKGKVLNQMSAFWFSRFGDVVPNHLIETDERRMPEELAAHRELLSGRAALVRKTAPIPIECVARGFLVGSGHKDYLASGAVCGIPLPPGLRLADRLPEPIFTPSTKADAGHDENIPFAEVERTVGAPLAAKLRDLTLALYCRAAEYALSRGILVADTKFEFGIDPASGEVIWIDEALTPDSSRFWPADSWTPGANPPSYDKQFVRDWLESTGWNKTPPSPELPAPVVAKTRQKYVEAFRRLTGTEPRL